MVFGARWAPTRPNKREPLYALPDDEFVARVNALYGAIPEVLLKRPRVLKMFLPALKGDFAVLDTYRHTPGNPIRVPVHVLDGTHDPVVGEGEAATWREVCAGPCSVHPIEGGHFFFRDDPEAVFAVLRQALDGR